MQLAQLAQNLASALIPRLRRLDGHFYNLIAALSGTRICHTLFPHTELLPGFGSLRDLQLRPAIDRRDFDLGAQRRLPDRQRHLDLDIVAFPFEEGMLLYLGGNEQVAWGRPHSAGIAL